MKSKMTKIEGMKSRPVGGSQKRLGANIMPTNAKTALGGVTKMLNAIKHIGRPMGGSKMPFAK